MSDSSYSDGAAAQPANRPEQAAPRLIFQGISKRYPGVQANDRISLSVMPGEIHAVLGENGAGKSTLMKIIYGAVRPDEGAIAWNGAPVAIRNPRAGARAGHRDGVPALRAVRDAHRGRERLARPRQDDDLRRGGARSRRVSGLYGLELDPGGMCRACRWASGSAWRSCARCSPSRSS